MELKGSFVQGFETEHTGGGIMLDLVVLKDGRVLGINDECVVLYKNKQEVYAATPEDKAMIDLTVEKHFVQITQMVKMTYSIEVEGPLTKENIRKQFDENYSYPDASTMEEDSAVAWGDVMVPVVLNSTNQTY